MAKKILFPLKVQFIVDKVDGKLTIISSRIKFICKLEEYPELPSINLVNKMVLKDTEPATSLIMLKSLLKNHLNIEDDIV